MLRCAISSRFSFMSSPRSPGFWARAESVLVKHQLLILNRSHQRAPNLRASDRFVAGLTSLFMRPSRLIRSAIVLKPSTLLNLPEPSKAESTTSCFRPGAGVSPVRRAPFAVNIWAERYSGRPLISKTSCSNSRITTTATARVTHCGANTGSGHESTKAARRSPRLPMAIPLPWLVSDTRGCLISSKLSVAIVRDDSSIAAIPETTPHK